MKLKRAIYLFIVLFALTLLPYIVVGLLSQPASDDLSYAGRASQIGLGAFQLKIFTEWSSRYISTFIMSFFTLITGLQAWGGISFSMILILISLSGYLFISEVTNYRLPRNIRILWTLLFVNLLFAITPLLADSFYWPAGNINHNLGLACLLFYLASLSRLYRQSTKLNLIIATLLAIIAIGINEMLLIAIIVILLVLIVSLIVRSNKFYINLISHLVILLPFIGLTLLAPGNFVRGTTSNNAFSYIKLIESYGNFVEFLISILTNPLIWLFVILTLIFIICFEKEVAKSNNPPVINWRILLFMLCILLILNVFILYTFIESPVRDRYAILPIGLILISLIYYAVNYLKNSLLRIIKKDVLKEHLNKYLTILLGVFFLLIVSQSNMKTALRDLNSGKSLAYYNEVTNIFNQLERCVKDKSNICFVTRTETCPELSICFKDRDSEFIQTNLAKYYHLEKVVIISE